ncbi:MAG: DUF535 family protein [Alphaproteobacteria bacterium]|jgi:uncharacterized protein VirK/YbjX|nr:DUF535 family protein [Alphaproteobacteria bacterium]
MRWARFCLRSAWKFHPSLTWLRYIESTPFLAQAPENIRRVLADKIHRPFARCHLTTTQRVNALITHYDILADLFPQPLLERIVEGRRVHIATLAGQHSDETYTITLSREMLSQHQGELTFLMLDVQSEVPLARLVVNLCRNADGTIQLVFNGMQGPGPEYKKRIVEVTRNLDGLRPKRAVVEVATAFAEAIGAHSIVAIGKKTTYPRARQNGNVATARIMIVIGKSLRSLPLPTGITCFHRKLSDANQKTSLPKSATPRSVVTPFWTHSITKRSRPSFL